MRGIHEQRLHYFVEAVRLGSVRAAADALDIAPSAVSRQIAQVEAELGVDLIERHRRGITPTEAGRLVLDYFRQRQTQLDGLRDAISDLQGLRTGRVVLAIGEGFIGDLSCTLGDFSARHPEIEVRVNVVGTNEVIRQVMEDEAQLGLVFNPPRDPHLRVHGSREQPLYALVAPRHPLAGARAPVTLAELGQHRLALPDISYGIRQMLDAVEQAAGQRLAPTLTCNTFALLKHYGSFACRNIYGRASGRRSQHATANALDIAGLRLADGRRISVARDWKGDPQAQRFLRLVRDGACRSFNTTLGPDYNAAHRDHFHVDMGGFRVCR